MFKTQFLFNQIVLNFVFRSFEFVLSFGFRIAVFRFIFNCAFIKNPALGAGFLITLRKTF